MITFMAELSKRAPIKPAPLPVTRWGRAYPIYALYIGPQPQNTYWTTVFEGRYDHEETRRLELYYDEWLSPVETEEALLGAQSPVFLIRGDYAYINLPKYPWLYRDSETAMSSLTGYLSGPKSSGDPTDLYLAGELHEAILEVPSISVRLSEPISGITLYTAFDFTLDNSGGAFDGENSHEYFNSPAYIKKAVKDNPGYEDFKLVREGLVENITINADRIEIKCAEKLRAFDDPVCKPILREGLLADFDFKEGVAGKPLPLVFGECDVPLIELTATEYLETDVNNNNDLPQLAGWEKQEDDTITLKGNYLIGEGVREIIGVYGENGNGDFTFNPSEYHFDPATGVLGVTKTEKMYQLTRFENGHPVYEKKERISAPKRAVVRGYPDNRIGKIVTFLVARSKRVPYEPAYWDMNDTENYISQSPPINIVIAGGEIKKAVSETLKSDMAYLIQKNNGTFSLRRWGNTYGHYTIASWEITQRPEKSFSEAQEYYFSTCVINYQYSQYKKEHKSRYFYTEGEEAARGRYLKRVEKIFDTHLTEIQHVKELAHRLGLRFCELKDTVSLGVGSDLSGFNLLDTVEMDVTVNGRTYSPNTHWIVREIDPAQDKLVLEEA